MKISILVVVIIIVSWFLIWKILILVLITNRNIRPILSWVLINCFIIRIQISTSLRYGLIIFILKRPKIIITILKVLESIWIYSLILMWLLNALILIYLTIFKRLNLFFFLKIIFLKHLKVFLISVLIFFLIRSVIFISFIV